MEKDISKYIIAWPEAESILSQIFGVDISRGRIDSTIDKLGHFTQLTEVLKTNNMDETDILSYIQPEKNLIHDLYIITDFCYSKQINGIFKVNSSDLVDFMDCHSKQEHCFFFNGDTYFISPDNQKLYYFHHNECWFYLPLPFIK